MDGYSNTICVQIKNDPLMISFDSGTTSTLTVDKDLEKWLNTLPTTDDKISEEFSSHSCESSTSQLANCSSSNINVSLIEISKEDFKSKIIRKGGQSIFDFYGKNNILNNCLRKLLVNITVDILISVYGYKPSTAAKIQFAKLIVNLLPALKDKNKEGYEAFFSPKNGGEGWIAWRLRHVRRHMPNVCRKRKASEAFKVKDIKDCSSEANALIETPEIQELLLFLNNACVQNDHNDILNKMEMTFTYRQSLLNTPDILQKFPRFLDTPGLINQDFHLLYPEANNIAEIFASKATVILEIYTKTETNLDEEVINEKEWNPVIRSLFALLHMLPPTARGNKIKKQSITNAKKKLLIYKPTNLPNSEIIEKRETNQPFLVAEGTTTGTISNYSIVIDGQFIPCEKNYTAAEAFATLFKSYYVFKVEYEHSLLNFWKFIQGFFLNIDAENIKFTSKMIELRSRINSYEENIK